MFSLRKSIFLILIVVSFELFSSLFKSDEMRTLLNFLTRFSKNYQTNSSSRLILNHFKLDNKSLRKSFYSTKTMNESVFKYPKVRRDLEVVDDFHGVKVRERKKENEF